MTRVGVWATDSTTVKACLWIPEEEWSQLPLSDRRALIAYIKSRVPVIRANPDVYASSAGGGVPADQVKRSITTMRSEAFVVMTMARQGTGWVRVRTAAESS